MSLNDWLHAWLARHPVKAPAPDRDAFTARVMRRLEQAPQPQRWVWPRLAWVAALAAAAVLMALQLPGGASRLAATIERDAAVLAALDVPVDGDLSDEQLASFIQLAEQPAGATDDAQWVEETIQLLDQLNESASDNNAADDEDWLHEIDSLEQESSASS